MCRRLKGYVSYNLILSLFLFEYILYYQHSFFCHLLFLLLIIIFGCQVSELVPGCINLEFAILRSGSFFIKMGVPGNGLAQAEFIQRHTICGGG